MERLSAREEQRIAEFLAEGAPFWRLRQEVPRSRHAIRRAVLAIQRPVRPERRRSPLRLSLSEREEIARGVAAGESVACDRAAVGSFAVDGAREVKANDGRRFGARTDCRSGGVIRALSAAMVRTRRPRTAAALSRGSTTRSCSRRRPTRLRGAAAQSMRPDNVRPTSA
jgi:hypothetical protein